MDEAVATLKEKYEREKNLLTEETCKLMTENDKVTEKNDEELWFFSSVFHSV